MSQEMDDLAQEVHDTVGSMESAIVFIDGLEQRLADAGTDPAKLKALRGELAAERDKLANAIAANPTPTP